MDEIKKIFIILFSAVCICLFFPLQCVFAGAPQSLTSTSAGSDTVPADGVTQASLTLTINGRGGDSVTVSIPSDGTAVISPTTTNLDTNGQAVFLFTSTTSGSDAVNVTDNTTATSFPSLGIVIFTSLVSPTPTTVAQASTGNSSGGNTSGSASCSKQAPSSAPNLYQLTKTKTAATLYFSPAGDPVDGYTVFYGLTQNADSNAINFSQGNTSGAIKYTINALLPNKVYYFRVQGTNGCATGPWSNTKSSGLSTLPITGPSSYLVSVGMGGVFILLAGIFFFVF